MGHAVRAATDLNLQMIVLSIDGVGAFDHVHRSSMLAILLEIPGSHGLLPFVRSTDVGESCYTWVDDGGVHHDIRQAEGSKDTPKIPFVQFGDSRCIAGGTRTSTARGTPVRILG